MYVMTFVAAVPTAQKEAYLAQCSKAAEIFKSHGALRVVDGAAAGGRARVDVDGGGARGLARHPRGVVLVHEG